MGQVAYIKAVLPEWRGDRMASRLGLGARIVLHVLGENLHGVLICAAAVSLLLAVVLYEAQRRSSAVVERSTVVGRVISFSTIPARPANSVGRGFRYRYRMDVGRGDHAEVVGNASRPLAIGSSASLELTRRENGAVSYVFSESSLR